MQTHYEAFTADFPSFPSLSPDFFPAPITTGATIKGIDLPQNVLDQLVQAGINPSWCNQYELAAADRGAAFDGRVFDEPGGDNFFDNITLDTHEIAQRDGHTVETSWRSRIESEREQISVHGCAA